MSIPVPFFSNLTADNQEKFEKKSVADKKQIVYKKAAQVYNPFLGLPCRRLFKVVPKPQQREPTLSHIFTPLNKIEEASKKPSGILSQIETSRVLENQWRDINSHPNYTNLFVTANTAEKFAKATEKKQVVNLKFTKNPSRKRKPDIFDC